MTIVKNTSDVLPKDRRLVNCDNSEQSPIGSILKLYKLVVDESHPRSESIKSLLVLTDRADYVLLAICDELDIDIMEIYKGLCEIECSEKLPKEVKKILIRYIPDSTKKIRDLVNDFVFAQLGWTDDKK